MRDPLKCLLSYNLGDESVQISFVQILKPKQDGSMFLRRKKSIVLYLLRNEPSSLR